MSCCEADTRKAQWHPLVYDEETTFYGIQFANASITDSVALILRVRVIYYRILNKGIYFIFYIKDSHTNMSHYKVYSC